MHSGCSTNCRREGFAGAGFVVNFFLLRQLLGVRTTGTERQGKVSKLAKGEILMLNIGSMSTGARVVANAREAIRWATDYLLKATAEPNTIYVRVGDANKDHACWERPEDMDTRKCVQDRQKYPWL